MKYSNLTSVELADGESRVIGLPSTMATAGDKIYILNGRVMSGWSMYFSLTCIRSPEPYGQIVDIIYNTAYTLAAIDKRATLSLGARFDIVDDPNTSQDDKPVKFLTRFVDKLGLNSGRFMKKVSAHLDIYGNSYVHIRRGDNGVANKLTILQPERMKIFLDPMTTKILFYIYLPPIIGGTVLVPYPYEKPNPNLIQNIALTFPTPIIIPPEDVMHLKQRDYTEYPFGFSLLKACMEPAQARLDYTILSPIIYKHYSKPIIHWMMDPVGLNPGQITNRLNAFSTQLENVEPTSDLVTTTRWSSNIISGVSKGFSAAMDMIADADSQIFAAFGVPETYFKPRGTSDRMMTEQDKVFVKEMKDRQEYFGEELKHKLFYPALMAYFGYESEDDIPMINIKWRKMIMTDDAIEIQNTIALLQAGIIDMEEARRRLSLPKTAVQAQQDLLKDFTEASSDKIQQQVPFTGNPVPLGVSEGQIPQGKTPPAPPTPLDNSVLYQDENSEFNKRAGESDESFYARLERNANPAAKKTKIDVEFGDNDGSAFHLGKRGSNIGAKGLNTPATTFKSCPYCQKSMFESADSNGQYKYRCENHGYIM